MSRRARKSVLFAAWILLDLLLIYIGIVTVMFGTPPRLAATAVLLIPALWLTWHFANSARV